MTAPNSRTCDVLIVGGGTGGYAAALAAVELGASVVLTEETDWLGGQLTSQIVPPDEHPWIEQFGCTRTYRAYRDRVRDLYRTLPLTPAARANPRLNPGGGWVSRLCHEPRLGHLVLQQMLMPALATGRLDLRLNTLVAGSLSLADGKTHGQPGVATHADRITEVTLLHRNTGETSTLQPRLVLDATETGELLPLAGAEYRLGAESQAQTGEPHALPGAPDPLDVQGLTWCFAMAHDSGSHRTLDRPASYDRWRAYQPDFWPGPLLGFDHLDPQSLAVKHLPLFAERGLAWFTYRQIVDPRVFAEGPAHPVTVVNWAANDYFVQSILETPNPAEALLEARELSLCLLYWLQTEADGHGYPGLYLRPDITDTPDGFAKTPYIRESRRLEAQRMLSELDLGAALHPGAVRMSPAPDSVGVGAYRIDLHPSCSGRNSVDLDCLPFQIPLGCLVPVRLRNLIPACKNLGVTHIANGATRLHPVEWNVGEAAGALAAHCCAHDQLPAQVLLNPNDFLRTLDHLGIERDWPALRPL